MGWDEMMAQWEKEKTRMKDHPGLPITICLVCAQFNIPSENEWASQR